MKLSPIIQGCMKWGVWGENFSNAEFQQAIETCLNAGITSFDHADIYGGYTTEASFGKALTSMHIPREKVQLISKCGIQLEHVRPTNLVKHYQYNSEYIIQSALKSIKDLNCAYLDVFLLHRPSPLLEGEKVAKAVDFLLQQGLIKSFGVSNFSAYEMAYLQQFIPINFNQVQLSLLESSALTSGLFDFMKLQEVQVMCWNPLGSYFTKANDNLKTSVKQLAEKHQTNEAEILLAWIVQLPMSIFPVIGTTNIKRIQNAPTATSFSLTQQEWFWLWESARGQQVP